MGLGVGIAHAIKVFRDKKAPKKTTDKSKTKSMRGVSFDLLPEYVENDAYSSTSEQPVHEDVEATLRSQPTGSSTGKAGSFASIVNVQVASPQQVMSSPVQVSSPVTYISPEKGGGYYKVQQQARGTSAVAVQGPSLAIP